MQDEINPAVKYKVVTVANPAAGANFTKTVPTGFMWEIQSVHFHLVTSATAATRVVKLTLTDGATMFAETRAGDTQIASLTYEYTFAPYMQALAQAGGVVGGAMPKVVVNAGSVIASSISSIQVGDQISGIALFVKEIDIQSQTKTL